MPVSISYDLTDDDFISGAGDDPIKITRRRQADAYNAVQVECLNRANDYNIYVAEAQDQYNIDRFGYRPMPIINCHAICEPTVARDVAQRLLQRALYIRNTYEFTLTWRYCLLEPMDLVTLTDTGMGISLMPVRITAIEEDETGNLHMTAEDFLTGTGTATSYGPAPTNAFIPNDQSSPANAITPIIFQPPLGASGGVSQIWIGSAGGTNWGGAEVWASDDNATYDRLGSITAAARMGVTTSSVTSGSDPDTTNTLSVNLASSIGSLVTVSTSQADALATLSYLGGELISYANATLTSAYNYSLTYLRRGKSGSTSASHGIGTQFMRLDEAIAKYDLNPAWIGKTVYIKLVSFNKTGGGLQDISTLTPTTYTVLTVAQSSMSIPASVTGKPAAGAVILTYIAPYSLSIALNLAGSSIYEGVKPAATAVFTLKKNGTSFGTISVAATSGAATLTSTATTFSNGDILTVSAPSTQDANMADIAINIVGLIN